MKYFKRNRLKNIMLKIVQKAWELTKRNVERYIEFYWPRDTSAMINSSLKWLKRFRVYDINKVPNLLIGSDVDYAHWVFSMAKRMARKGKSVKWTNPNTRKIEKDILGNTIAFTKRAFQLKLTDVLDNFNLSWLFGKGRMPKNPELHMHETTTGRKSHVRKLPRYRGKRKLIKRL